MLDVAQAIADPYPTYRWLQEHDPVHWDEALDAWILTRYEDIKNALQDPRISSQRRSLEGFPALNYLDPPDHTRLRRLVNKAFTSRIVERLRPRIQSIIDGLLDRVEGNRIDVVRELAAPLPVAVIADLVGVPQEDTRQTKLWSDAMMSVDFIGPARRPAEAARAAHEFAAYLADALEARRRSPGEDLMSEMIALEERGDVLSDLEIITLLILLFAAGHETTTNLIGNGLLAMFARPDALREFRDRPQNRKLAIDELLRYDTPVQMQGRRAIADVEISGRRIESGDAILLFLGAANRDARVFEDADQLVLDRDPNPHLGFGHGIHYCLGAPLAKVEAELALGTLLERAPAAQLTSHDLVRIPSLVFRGVESIVVNLS